MSENNSVCATASLPSAIDSLPHIYTPPRRPLEPDDKERVRSGHVSKHEHFRRLEDRLDKLYEEMAATHRLVQNLTMVLEQQSETPRPNRPSFGIPTGKKSLGNLYRPVGVGPSASLPLAATFLSTIASMDGHTPHEPTVPLSSEAPDNVSAERTDLIQDHTATDTRKLSATNPIALLPPKHATKPHVVSMAVAHAATFIAEMTNAASAKKAHAKSPSIAVSEPVAIAFGPDLTRRFSISSLDTPNDRPRGSRVSRAFKWSRNLFRPRLESVVSPEEIHDARTEYAKLHRFSIRHNSVSRMLWDTIVMLMIIIDVVVTPFSLSFRYFPHGIDAYNTFGNIIFFTDFIVNLLSSYTTPRGVLISGPRHTMSHYLTSPWALPDFLSWFPFENLVQSQQGRFLGVAKVIRLVKVSQLARRFHSARKAGVFRFLKLLGTVFIVSHCLSCFWNWVAVDWRRDEDGYLEMTLGQQYAHCWSMVIGSLNASPPAMHSTIEEVSIAIFMLIGNVLQATVFGSVAVLIQSFDEEEVAYNKKLISTYERCRFLDIPETLARRIQGYYENLYQETRSVDPDADAFINELSPALICEVKFQLYRDMIKQIPFLSATHINPVVIEMLILHLRTVIYMQDDVLIRKGEVGDWMGFIGSKGSVGVLDPKSEFRKIIRILRKGDYFGEMALLQRSKRSTTALALTWVQIHVLCRNDLDDVKAQYPEQAEILEHEIHKYMQTKVTYK